jgi:hypothetical protein
VRRGGREREREREKGLHTSYRERVTGKKEVKYARQERR